MLTLADTPLPEAPRSSAETRTTLIAGEYLFREGEPRRHIFRIDRGSLCLFRQSADGSREVLEFAFPGDLVGLGYLDSHVSAAQATMETALSCVPLAEQDAAVAASTASKARLAAAIAREVAFLDAHRELPKPQVSPDGLKRVAALFVTLARCNAYEGRNPALITDSLSCGVVAGYLGMDVDELARWLGDLEARGLVEPSGSGLHLKDVEALERLADA